MTDISGETPLSLLHPHPHPSQSHPQFPITSYGTQTPQFKRTEKKTPSAFLPYSLCCLFWFFACRLYLVDLEVGVDAADEERGARHADGAAEEEEREAEEGAGVVLFMCG